MRLEQRLGSCRLLGTLRLEGWRLVFDKRGADGSAKANLRPAPGSDHAAWAAVYAVERDRLELLDHFEGCGRGYETVRFEIDMGRQTLEALAYLTPSQWTTRAMRPYRWYRELVAAGARFHGFPADYVSRLAGQPVSDDPDSQRASARQALLRQINDHRR
ncbi:MAG: gamma-glutamylcyclotransferase [Pseudomonadota bacterium]|nr:MAG: gamma-glutamylcyclotransferase [Pseudomonadota bacterium]